MWKNDQQDYGAVSLIFHWAIALLIISLFVMGIWMRELDYYDPWYHRAPELHKSLGLLTALVFLLRWIWRLLDPLPKVGVNLPAWQRGAARCAHSGMRLLILLVLVSGYLIATADGKPVALFDLWAVPAVITPFSHQEDIAGVWHDWLAWVLMGLVALHLAAALKHHFIDRDARLLRMLGFRKKR